MNFLKRALYGLVKNDSRNMGRLGNAIDSEWLQEEAQKNQQDPSKALRKSAMYAATIYGGGLLGGAAGAGANAAGQAAGQAGAMASQQAAQQAAMLAAQEAAKQSALHGGGLLAEGGMTAAMTPGLMSTGPGSQAAMLAQQNAGFGLSGMAKTAEAASGAQGLGMGSRIGSGMMGGLDKGLDVLAGTGGNRMQGMQMMNGLLGGGGSPPPPSPPPPRPQGPPQPPPPSGYGAPVFGGGLPPELAGLPPNDPRVIEYMKSRGM